MAFSRVALFDLESIALLGMCCTRGETGSQACLSVQVGAPVPDQQPNNPAATICTPKHAPAGAGKAAFPTPSAKGIVSSGKATTANASRPGKGAPSAAQASPATSPAAGSSQVNHIVLQLLLCDALHCGECTAEVVHQPISVLFVCAGHDGGLASARAYCYIHVLMLTYAWGTFCREV